MSFYIMPIGGVGTHIDPFTPKYVSLLQPGFAWRDLPLHWGVVFDGAADAAEDSAIAANSDALVVPPLDNTVAVNATKNALEALGIPAQWVTSGMTYRTVLRVVVGMTNFSQTYQGITGTALILTGNLNLTMSQLPVSVMNGLMTTEDTLGIDHSGITGSTTLREVLRIVAQQIVANWPHWPTGGSIALGDL